MNLMNCNAEKVVIRDQADINSLLYRASARILGTQPGTPERASAERYRAAIFKSYQISESRRNDLKIAQ